MDKYEQNLILIMQMHYQEIKYNFKIYMNNSCKSQNYKGSNRLSNLHSSYKRKNRALKIQTNFKHSINVALKINK